MDNKLNNPADDFFADLKDFIQNEILTSRPPAREEESDFDRETVPHPDLEESSQEHSLTMPPPSSFSRLIRATSNSGLITSEIIIPDITASSLLFDMRCQGYAVVNYVFAGDMDGAMDLIRKLYDKYGYENVFTVNFKDERNLDSGLVYFLVKEDVAYDDLPDWPEDLSAIQLEIGDQIEILIDGASTDKNKA